MATNSKLNQNSLLVPAVLAAGMLSGIVVAKYVGLGAPVALASAVALAASISLLAFYGRTQRFLRLTLVFIFSVSFITLLSWLKFSFL